MSEDVTVTEAEVAAGAAEFRRITKGDGMLTPQDKPMSIYEMAAHHILVAALAVSPLREQVQKLTEENERLDIALRTARAELMRWGWGAMHSFDDRPQAQSVRDVLAACDAALEGPSSKGEQ